ncbi:hypothetical protein HNQ91_003424 [Filimonas zeae]|uniref:DUF4747 domain-containing protein n=1 Tax=Filimonas zeae TaxID=1737353 RepID=A0A917J1I5_9BACT|nr:DUF4747 family protein [Filimonas zeae]MDR6340359.1 hypothetical protein [Filimonas zeae]GGH72369.1 hypothetical protein GCM10011379_32710 [Filimonas zeae]
MADEAPKKKPKEVPFIFYGVNIKVRSENPNKEELYTNLIEKIFRLPRIDVAKDKAMAIKNLDRVELPFNEQKYLAFEGVLTRYSLLENNEWFDEENKEVTTFNQIPQGLNPGAILTNFIFIPEIHKFYFDAKAGGVSLNNVVAFFKIAISKVMDFTGHLDGQNYDVSIISETDQITKIINAPRVKKLTISVSYTNDDIGGDAMDEIDRQLKNSNIGRAKLNLSPDNTGSINTETNFVKGFLELASENGNATATIINEQGKKEKIDTEQYPRKITVKINDGQEKGLIKVLFEKMMQYYRSATNE